MQKNCAVANIMSSQCSSNIWRKRQSILTTSEDATRWVQVVDAMEIKLVEYFFFTSLRGILYFLLSSKILFVQCVPVNNS